MHFDANRSLLVVSPEDLRALAEHDDAQLDPWPRAWVDAGVVIDNAHGAPRLHPIVSAVVAVVRRGMRDIVLERFDGRHLAVTSVSYDGAGNVTFTDVTTDGWLTITLSTVAVLPAMLEHALGIRIPVGQVDDERAPISTTAGDIDDALAAAERASDESRSDPPMAPGVGAAAAALTSLERSWRLSAGWRGDPVDAAITVAQTTHAGSWIVEHDADVPDAPPARDTAVTLVPVDPFDLMERIGCVVAGKERADCQPLHARRRAESVAGWHCSGRSNTTYVVNWSCIPGHRAGRSPSTVSPTESRR